MGGIKLKNIKQEDEGRTTGVCVWKMSNGDILGDSDGNFLSLEGPLYNKFIESKLYDAVKGYIGEEVEDGSPFWFAGARKISDDEYEDQVDRFNNGLIPDPLEAIQRALDT